MDLLFPDFFWIILVLKMGRWRRTDKYVSLNLVEDELDQDDVSMVCICLDVSFENWVGPKRKLDRLPTTHFQG